jgi:hypothetical protein
MNLISRYLLIVSSSILLFTFPSCNKDENSQSGNYRIKEMKIYREGMLDSDLIYEYSEGRISKITNYKPGTDEVNARFEFDYYLDSIACTEYICLDDTLEIVFHSSYKYLDHSMVNYNLFGYTDEIYSPDMRVVYEYLDSHLVNELHQHYSGGSWDLLGALQYEYENSLLIRSRLFSNEFGWIEMMREEAGYQDDKLKIITRYPGYSGDSLGSFRYEFEYEADRLTRINYFANDSGFVLVGKREFKYDGHGNLISMTDNYMSDYDKEEYFYEEGVGNYEQLIQPGGGISSELTLPHPTRRLLDNATILKFISYIRN